MQEERMAQRQIAVVTGASSGIGFATASLLAERGYRTFGTSREPEARSGPKGVELVKLDVDSDESARAAIEGIVTTAGPIDILVNNAGYGLFGSFEETTLEEARAQVETNFWDAVRMANLVLPSMRQRRCGRIINVSSVLGYVSVPFHAFYVAAKHALEGYSEALSIEMQPFGVHVVLIEPSYIRTGFFNHQQKVRTRLDPYRGDSDRVIALMGQRIRTGSEPETVAKVILEAAGSTNPDVRYSAGFGSGILKASRALLPTGLFDRVVRQSLALN
jgi:NAD(P)-dependent dehydrogenase (short-subunit alcohol dehydrogenase family)